MEIFHAVGRRASWGKTARPSSAVRGKDKRPVCATVSATPACLKDDLPIDETILSAGDHNGATYHQHCFIEVVKGQVEVTLDDGIWAVRIGQAAQQSALSGEAIRQPFV